jgi:hypothetical protein
MKNSRKGTYSQGGARIASASNAGWNAATGHSKPVNTKYTNVDAYKMK